MKSMADLKGVVDPTAFPPKAEVTIARVTNDISQSKPTITLYVRRGDDIVMGNLKIKTRVISLRPIPEKVSVEDLLALGFAYDGDSVALSVDQYTEVDEGKDGRPFTIVSFADSVLVNNMYHTPWTLTDALRQVQANIVEWLRSLGYEVKIA